MRRREFITLLGGAAAGWPLAAHAQQPDRAKRIGALMSTAAEDPEGQARMTAFQQKLQQLGWIDGGNVRIDARWSASDAERMRRGAEELVALSPDVILASGGTVLGPLLRTTRAVPVVFTQIPDPVGAGFVESLARPGGNATGFTQFEYGISSKWLELLKEVAPRVTRAAVLRDSTIPAGIGQFAVLQAVAPSLGVDLRPIDVRDARRDRARRHGLLAHREWRPDGGVGRVAARSSRADHHTGGAAQPAGGLFQSLVRHWRRPDVLRGRIRSTRTDARPATSIVSSRARNRPTCRFRRRPNTNW